MNSFFVFWKMFCEKLANSFVGFFGNHWKFTEKISSIFVVKKRMAVWVELWVQQNSVFHGQNTNGNSVPATTGAFTYLRSKQRKGNKEKDRNSFKAEIIKRLSPRSKCYCFCKIDHCKALFLKTLVWLSP